MSTQAASYYSEEPLKMKFMMFVLIRLLVCLLLTACLWNIVQLQNAVMEGEYSRDWYTVLVASATIALAGISIPVIWLIFFRKVRRKFIKYTNAGWTKKY